MKIYSKKIIKYKIINKKKYQKKLKPYIKMDKKT